MTWDLQVATTRRCKILSEWKPAAQEQQLSVQRTRSKTAALQVRPGCQQDYRVLRPDQQKLKRKWLVWYQTENLFTKSIIKNYLVFCCLANKTSGFKKLINNKVSLTESNKAASAFLSVLIVLLHLWLHLQGSWSKIPCLVSPRTDLPSLRSL